MRKIEVVEFNPEWDKLYYEEKEKIDEILKEELIAIYHIGSTSVSGLKAKPIIDIMPVVWDIKKVDLYNARFEAIGYTCMGEFGIQGRRFYHKGGNHRTHHIHIFGQDSKEDIIRHLAVRDYLIAYADEAIRYGELKVQLAQSFAYDIEGYCNGKDSYVKVLEQKALDWYHSEKRTKICKREWM